jgi:HK97 family phage prohead protease
MTTRLKRRRGALTPLTERRFFVAQDLEVRGNSGKTPDMIVRGTAIRYCTDYEVHDQYGSFTERMAPGAARNVIDHDCRFLLNHEGLPMARTTSGTLSLRDSDEGLLFEARLDARMQISNDVAVAVARGDISQCSAGFIVAKDDWNEAQEDRTIFELRSLLDVSAVTFPASPTTSISLLNQSEARARRIARGQIGAERALAFISQPRAKKEKEKLDDVVARFRARQQAQLRESMRGVLRSDQKSRLRDRVARESRDAYR